MNEVLPEDPSKSNFDNIDLAKQKTGLSELNPLSSTLINIPVRHLTQTGSAAVGGSDEQ